MKTQMLTVLLTFGGLLPLVSAEFPLKVLSVEDGVITGRFAESLLLNLPDCQYSGQTVDLEYLNANTNETKILSGIFKVPNCTSGSTSLSQSNIYQLKNLSSNTEYKLHYKIGSESSRFLMATTRGVSDYNDINDGLPARSGAMVVITVILSVAMLILLIFLIVSTVLTSSSG